MCLFLIMCMNWALFVVPLAVSLSPLAYARIAFFLERTSMHFKAIGDFFPIDNTLLTKLFELAQTHLLSPQRFALALSMIVDLEMPYFHSQKRLSKTCDVFKTSLRLLNYDMTSVDACMQRSTSKPFSHMLGYGHRNLLMLGHSRRIGIIDPFKNLAEFMNIGYHVVQLYRNFFW